MSSRVTVKGIRWRIESMRVRSSTLVGGAT
jgi:hypothetical protein